MFNTIMLSLLAFFAAQLIHINDPSSIKHCLLLMLAISAVNGLRELGKNADSYIVNILHKQLKEKNDALKIFQIELVKETIKKLYFSLIYSANIKNTEFFEKSQKSLYNLGINKEIIDDPNKLLQFIEDINANKIKIEFNPKTKTYTFKEN